jgi:hypothetical protein
MHEKLASALLHIRRGVEGDNWLIKGELRKASAKEICSSIDWDHVRRWAENGSNEPQNLQPLIRAEHREKSRKDATEVAKGKRMAAKNILIWDSSIANWAEPEVKAKPKAKIRSRDFPTKEERRAFLEKVKS